MEYLCINEDTKQAVYKDIVGGHTLMTIDFETVEIFNKNANQYAFFIRPDGSTVQIPTTNLILEI